MRHENTQAVQIHKKLNVKPVWELVRKQGVNPTAMTMSTPSLPQQWLTQGTLDAEYKQYLFLAWMQAVRRQFDHARIYPALGEVIVQHQQLHAFDEARRAHREQQLGRVVGLDWEQLRPMFEAAAEHPDLEAYFDECLEFALPELDKAFAEGRDLFDWVEHQIHLTPVGLTPLYTNDGYLFLYDESQHFLRAYRYEKSWVELDEDRMIRVSFEPVEERFKKLSESFESVKLGLIKRFSDLPNPATFLARVTMGFPLEETLLPISKRLLLRALQET